MTAKHRLLRIAARMVRRGVLLAGRSHAASLAAQLVHELEDVVLLDQPTPKGGSLRFYTPGPMPAGRARTLLTKEPDTIAWIDALDSRDTLWDVGANVGVFSLYAGLRGLTVVAFEPAAANFFVLCRNVELNRLGHRIRALCVALSDRCALDYLHMQSTEPGSSHHTFARSTDWRGQPFQGDVVRQACLGYSIDEFLARFDPPFPCHLKIDVDGLETKVLQGAGKTLRDARLRSVLVELNMELEDEYRTAHELLLDAGFALQTRPRPLQKPARHFENVQNHIYTKPTLPGDA